MFKDFCSYLLNIKKNHPAATFLLSYIVAAADGHVGVTWGDPLGRAGARQVVVVDAVGVVAGDGGEGVQRQIPVLQTATHTHTHTEEDFKKGCLSRECCLHREVTR